MAYCSRRFNSARTNPTPANAKSYQRNWNRLRMTRVEMRMHSVIATSSSDPKKVMMREGVEGIVQTIGCPSELPRPEICLPALLVEVGENKKEQQGHYARNAYYADGNCIHAVETTLPAPRHSGN